MIGLTEDSKAFRYIFMEQASFNRIKVTEFSAGSTVFKVAFGRVRGTKRFEVHAFIFPKATFQSALHVKTFLDAHFKAEIPTLLNTKVWDESRRRLFNAYMAVSEIK